MLRHPTPPLADVIVPRDAWLKLFSGGLEDINNPKEVWEVAVEAIDEWARRHNPSAFRQMTLSGYQWKHLFLPPGTLLRTVFRGKNYHCLVDEDNLMYEGKPISPNGFVNAVGGIRRNAWRSIWVLFPKTTEWKLADTLRTRTRSRPTRARKYDKAEVPSLNVPEREGAGTTGPMPNAPSARMVVPASLAVAQQGAIPQQPGAPTQSLVPEPPAMPGQPQTPPQPGTPQQPASMDQPSAAAAESRMPNGSIEPSLARLLLAELFALVQRLAQAQPAAIGAAGPDSSTSKSPGYGVSASGYKWPGNPGPVTNRWLHGRTTVRE